jgi:hypothetical protein
MENSDQLLIKWKEIDQIRWSTFPKKVVDAFPIKYPRTDSIWRPVRALGAGRSKVLAGWRFDAGSLTQPESHAPVSDRGSLHINFRACGPIVTSSPQVHASASTSKAMRIYFLWKCTYPAVPRAANGTSKAPLEGESKQASTTLYSTPCSVGFWCSSKPIHTGHASSYVISTKKSISAAPAHRLQT